MAITFEQIEQANGKLTTIQLGTGGKKKDYVMVPQRVKAFRMLYPDGFILTDILSHENNVVVMQARAGYYDAHGNPVVLGTGLAFEERGKGMVNGTSYIENCETSAVGRALGFLALGVDGGGICSAEELVNAITAQSQNAQQQPKNAQGTATVTTTASVPPVQPQVAQSAPQAPQTPPAPKGPNPEPLEGETPSAFMKRRIAEMKAEFENFNFIAARQGLIDGGAIEDKPSATLDMAQAKNLMTAVYKVYATTKKKAS